ncbi:hypothetical protein Taro_000577 [Colocasia esculenta]|uniref:Uncharacterized protein n=1 Tax=Colocasia esculenta TaxID=4460 RepID=A0A843TFK8_COLES|nr:hypothetical protein [Colocasia esculenta]
MIQCRPAIPDSKTGLLGEASSVDLPAFGVDLRLKPIALAAVRKQKNNHTKDTGDLSWFGPSHMEVLRPVPKQPLGISLTKGTVPLKDTTTPSTPADLLLFPGQEGSPLLLQKSM